MITWSVCRANLLAWRGSTRNYLKSNPLQRYQEYDKFPSGLSVERKMSGNEQKSVTQIRRGVSTQAASISHEGNGKDRKSQNHLEDVRHHAVSTKASTSKSGNSDNEALNGSKSRLSGKEILNMKHSESMEVGWSLMRFIKGKWGSTQKSIEEETGVKIIFPSSKLVDSIILEGDSAESIAKASERIQIIVDKAVNSRELDYSHFVSLPLAIYPKLVDKLVNFQNAILGSVASDEESRIEKSIFINPKTFHLTVLMLKLWNKDRVKAAAEVLQRVSPKVMDALKDQPLFIRLKGLDLMRGSLAKAGVLYAPVEEIGGEGRLLRACQVIIDAFTEAGLVVESDLNHKLKLHATVMNARHRKRNSHKRNSNSFDARGIFDRFGSEEWGEYHIREAHLSQRFLYDESGYYHCCASIPFPQRAGKGSELRSSPLVVSNDDSFCC